MIVLDTNVVSEVMRSKPAERVLQFLEAQPSETLAITSITVAEILYGVRRHPSERRRSELEKAFNQFLREGFERSVLAFDMEAASHYAQIVVDRQRDGRPIDAFDAMIAGITRSRDARIATRDVEGFARCGVEILNPWT
jgi:predicted nucleic acid-binding protein